jgi:hypothetical protein
MTITVKDSLAVNLVWTVEGNQLVAACEASQVRSESRLLYSAHKFPLPSFLSCESNADRQAKVLDELNLRRDGRYLRLSSTSSCGECEVVLLRDGLHLPPILKSANLPWITTGLWLSGENTGLRDRAIVQRLSSFPIRFAKSEETAASTLNLDFVLAATYAIGDVVRPPGRFVFLSQESLGIEGLSIPALPLSRPDDIDDHATYGKLSYLSSTEWSSLVEAMEGRPYAGFVPLEPMVRHSVRRRRGDASSKGEMPRMYRGVSLSSSLLVPSRYILHEIPLKRGLFEDVSRRGYDSYMSSQSLWLLESLRLRESAKLFRSRQDAIYYAFRYRETGVLLRKNRVKNWWLGFDDEVARFANAAE